MEIKISVIIPTYRRPNLLKRCILQLCKQSVDRSAFEVIVVSDGPDAQTASLVTEIADKGIINLKFLSSGSKQGPAHARNVGWLSAKGRLIAFTDDDCLPDTNWLSAILTSYQNEDLIAYSGNTIVPISRQPHDFELNTARLQDADFITANCVCTKNALLKVGGFDNAFKQAWREDSDLEFRLIQHKIPIVKLPRAVVVHPVREFPWAVSIKEQKKVIYDALLFRKFPELYRQKIKNTIDWNYYLIVLLTLACIYFMFTGFSNLALVVISISLILVFSFTWKRVKNAKKSIAHVTEMLFTSLVIPFVALYWRMYGALKFKVLLL